MALSDREALFVAMSWRVYVRLGLGTIALGISEDAATWWVDFLFFLLGWLTIVSGARAAYREGATR